MQEPSAQELGRAPEGRAMTLAARQGHGSAQRVPVHPIAEARHGASVRRVISPRNRVMTRDNRTVPLSGSQGVAPMLRA
jgi:hypothetical protein